MSLPKSYMDIDKYKTMLGIYLLEKRESLSMSHKDLAKISRIPPCRLAKLESGQTLPKKETLDNLKRCLNLDEGHLHKIEDVARMAYIAQLLEFLNQERQTT